MRKLHILHTNDLHSHFEQMPLLAGGIRALQSSCEQRGEDVVIVDLGDHSDRMSPLTEGTWGEANVAVMNQTGYQFAAIGNNEGLTFPKEKLLSLYNSANFQVICCNLKDEATADFPPFVKPYAIQEIDSLRIGWISATAPYPVYEMLGWQILDPFDQIEQIVAQIRQQTDVIIVLSHLGYKMDRELANRLEGVDLIIGAHSHHLLQSGVVENGTFIIQAGKFGNYLGHTTISIDMNTKRVIGVSGICREATQFAPDQQLSALIEQKRQEADHTLNSLVTELAHPLVNDWEEESPLGNLLAEGLRSWVEAELSMVNAGQLLFSLPQGRVTRKDLLALCPHPINPCKVMIKGKYIKQLLEQALDEAVIHLEVQGLGFRGKVMGWMCIDGLSVHYHPRRQVGRRITEMYVQGVPFQDERVYSVGTVDMFTFGWIFPLFREAEEIEYFFPEFIRDVLAKELSSVDALERSAKKRWILMNEGR
ncbi:hypothetical protein BEP19_13985 [Ammoniphilus oxalaticus]|uniref:Metallophosphoesterase n=1 Tax=Ammoniphilus oxalaticus TaxID=66863 RepID=A0A419SEY2_9BACL|nr:bifunctional UDP-sugar hydrolase/5'-nucleotidase [Ammoniphilus oxalaticus]RKD21872.1 hypothetical protein BEP19_13985 [Ammoniphilus oxalaticus]